MVFEKRRLVLQATAIVKDKLPKDGEAASLFHQFRKTMKSIEKWSIVILLPFVGLNFGVSAAVRETKY